MTFPTPDTRPDTRHPIYERRPKIKKLTLAITTWILAITAAHFALNVNWQVLMNDRLPEADRKLNVAYIPVT
ncbi:MAG: hypothetical protein QOF63_1682 [Thermoanaerobaculia bacterium]|nr:hypothetical protein [Thermoanaerobaculia bacterium]